MPALKKRFGQHFLQDPHILQQIAAVCAAAPGDTLVEIGPGTGALSAYLLDGLAPLHVIEIDRDLVATLARRFGARLIIHQADALTVDFCALLPGSLRVVGNLPYNISTPLLFRLLAQPCVASMVFLLQKEVVERLAAAPATPAYGRLSVMVQAYCRVTPLMTVGAAAFFPPPRVESQLVQLVLEPGRAAIGNPRRFALVVRTAFAKRRKMLRHSLRGVCTAEDWVATGIDPMRRAETLSVDEFAALADTIGARRHYDGGSP